MPSDNPISLPTQYEPSAFMVKISSGFCSFLRNVGKLLSYRRPILVFHGTKARAKEDVLTAASTAFPHNIPNGFCINALTICFHASRQSVSRNVKKPFSFLGLLAFNLNCHRSLSAFPSLQLNYPQAPYLGSSPRMREALIGYCVLFIPIASFHNSAQPHKRSRFFDLSTSETA